MTTFVAQKAILFNLCLLFSHCQSWKLVHIVLSQQFPKNWRQIKYTFIGNILDFAYLLLLCSYFKSTTKHLVSAKIMLLVSEGVVISPPLSSLTLYGGDITPFLEHYGGGGGFPPRG